MGLLYLRGRTIQEVGGKMMMGSSIYGVAVIVGRYAPEFTVCPNFVKICGLAALNMYLVSCARLTRGRSLDTMDSIPYNW